MFKEKIIIEMKEVFKEIPFGIEHTLKVLKNAEDIMNGENIGEEEKEFISIIAILHDIGVLVLSIHFFVRRYNQHHGTAHFILHPRNIHHVFRRLRLHNMIYYKTI